jgi:hypothetical protein
VSSPAAAQSGRRASIGSTLAGAARRQIAGDVGAGDEEHQGHRAKQHPQRCRHRGADETIEDGFRRPPRSRRQVGSARQQGGPGHSVRPARRWPPCSRSDCSPGSASPSGAAWPLVRICGSPARSLAGSQHLGDLPVLPGAVETLDAILRGVDGGAPTAPWAPSGMCRYHARPTERTAESAGDAPVVLSAPARLKTDAGRSRRSSVWVANQTTSSGGRRISTTARRP